MSQNKIKSTTEEWIHRIILWSGRQDLNLRPLGPKPSALPNCATPRFTEVDYTGEIEILLAATEVTAATR
jgi:hypothetical protein